MDADGGEQEFAGLEVGSQIKIDFIFFFKVGSGRMEEDPDFDTDVIGIDGEDARKADNELVQYNLELELGFAFFSSIF